jgi:hypothetical protein
VSNQQLLPRKVELVDVLLATVTTDGLSTATLTNVTDTERKREGEQTKEK